MNTIVFTTQAQSWDICQSELQAVFPDWGVKWLVPGVGLLNVDCDWSITGLGLQTARAGFVEISRAIQNAKPVFLRHIFPASQIFETDADRFDTPAWREAVDSVSAAMDQRGFSVQTRILDESVSFSKYDLTQSVSETIQNSGKTVQVKSPAQVVSILIFRSTVYMGLSNAIDNLSAWPGGMRRYERQEGLISRAEFKLLEAIEAFALDLSGCQTALDLGAAPGGWSKILAERGMEVTAIDPGQMAPIPRVTHYRELAQDFLKRDSRQFDLLVNDMRMDVRESVAISIDASACLRPGGLMVMTFKLPQKKKKTVIHHGLEALSKRFEIEHVKQLFHNRSEITVSGRVS